MLKWGHRARSGAISRRQSPSRSSGFEPESATDAKSVASRRTHVRQIWVVDSRAARASAVGSRPRRITSGALWVIRIEQALLAVHTAALTVVAVVHLTYSPKLVLAFIGAHNRFIRDYWAIVDHGKNNAEHGIWPGLLSAAFGDLAWIVLILTPVALPLLLLKHKLSPEPGVGFGTVLRRFLVGNLVALLFAFTAGALLGALFVGTSFVVLPLAGRPFSAEFGTIIELVASGVIFADLAFAVTIWWVDLDDAPGTEWALGIGAAAGIALAVAGGYATRVHTEIVASTEGAPLLIYGYHSREDVVREEDSSIPAIYHFSQVYERSEFSGDELTAPLEQIGDLTLTFQHIFAYSKATPFLDEMPAFHHTRPHWVSWERGTVSVGYELSAFAKPSIISERELEFSTEARNLVKTPQGTKAWVRVEPTELSSGFGMVLRRSQDSDIEVSYAATPGSLKLMTMQKPAKLLGERKLDELPKSLALKSEQLGVSFWLNDRPVWLLSESQIARADAMSLAEPCTMQVSVQTGEQADSAATELTDTAKPTDTAEPSEP